ncbi:MAG: hypothetical protein AAFY69_02795 [Pseudomonadota bacterium]
MRHSRLAVFAAVLMLAAGCGGESEVIVHDDDATASDQSDTPIADELKEPLEKAAAVEDLAKSRKEEMDRRLAEMEGETDDDDDADP